MSLLYQFWSGFFPVVGMVVFLALMTARHVRLSRRRLEEEETRLFKRALEARHAGGRPAGDERSRLAAAARSALADVRVRGARSDPGTAEAVRTLERFLGQGGLSADEARAALRQDLIRAHGVPPMVLGTDWEVTPLSPTSRYMAGLDVSPLDKRQDKGVSSPGMETMTRHPRPDPSDPDERQARLAAAVAAAVFDANQRERKKEEADSLFMKADPFTCRHLIAEDVTLLDGEVVARLCPACGTQLGLKEDK